MQWKVDWLSFVVPLPDLSNVAWGDLAAAVSESVGEWAGEHWPAIKSGREFELYGGRAPFSMSLGRRDGGVRIYFSAQFRFCLLEITGGGCTLFEEKGDILQFMVEHRDECSRLDVAVDFVTDVQPGDFAALRDVRRFTAHGEVVSTTGSTCYVGSMKSDRYARVYRYNPPHPRADSLRVEHVFRKNSAKLAIDHLVENGSTAWITAIGQIFGWKHALWDVTEFPSAKMSARVVERPEAGKTVFWIYNTVVPCLARLISEERIETDEFMYAVNKELAKLEAADALLYPGEGE